MDSETQRTDALYETLAWFETNKKRVAIYGGAALLTIGLIATVTWYRKEREFRASEALSSIRIVAAPSEAPLAPDTAEKLQKLAIDYSGTAASARAELIRAGLLFTEGKYADAQAAFEKFVRDHPENRWVSEAYYGVAVCFDAQSKPAEAIAKYEDFLRRFSADPKVDQARLHLATLLEAQKRPADAVKEYDKIVKATSYSPFQGEAQERLRRLLTQYPNLAPSNPPAFSPTLPTPKVTTPAVTGAVTSVRTNPVARTSAPAVLKTNPVAPKTPTAPAPAK